eukprot:5114135-Amphidinium_carterae.1
MRVMCEEVVCTLVAKSKRSWLDCLLQAPHTKVHNMADVDGLKTSLLHSCVEKALRARREMSATIARRSII